MSYQLAEVITEDDRGDGPAAISVGRQIYEVIQILAKKGNGHRTYLAEARNGRKKIVVKQRSLDYFQTYQSIAEIRDGINLPDSLLSRHIGLGQDGQSIYAAFNYLPGTSLKDSYLGHEYSDRWVQGLQDITRGLFATIGVISQAKVVHRDTCPGNTIIVELGLMKWLQGKRPQVGLADTETMTTLDDDRASSVVGNPFTMAPEMAHGDGVNATTDFFGAGMSLYLCLPQAFREGIFQHGLQPTMSDRRKVLAMLKSRKSPHDGRDPRSILDTFHKQRGEFSPQSSRGMENVLNVIAASTASEPHLRPQTASGYSEMLDA